MSAALSCDRVAVRYGVTDVFAGVTLAFGPATLTALVGPNGSGKSSLLRVLAGVQRPDAGVVSAKSKAALIVSAVNPPPDVSPFELASYGIALGGPWWRLRLPADAVSAAELALSRVGLSVRQHDPVSTLSAGEVQRSWIAAALASSREILLIDEPTSHLDLRYQLEVLRTLRALARDGAIVVAAIHDLTLAARFFDRIVLLSRGNAVAGPPEEVLEAGALSEAFGVEVTTFRHPTAGHLVCTTR